MWPNVGSGQRSARETFSSPGKSLEQLRSGESRYGNSVTAVMLLNNIKAKHPANQIVAVDWARGVVVVDIPSGGMTVDPTTLQIKGES